MSLHIRAVGPWTSKLRDRVNCDKQDFPCVRINGPFGNAHQTWYNFDCSIMIGAGIGVTPYASILKDVARRLGRKDGDFGRTKKLYFIWVTRSQKHFEWLTEIIAKVEEISKNYEVDGFFESHIYITQFYDKFDLRTTMLYLSERHFQRTGGRSLFTGLEGTTHFGRPDFENVLYTIQYSNPELDNFGVFSTGPPAVTKSVARAVKNMNRSQNKKFVHRSDNF